MSLGRENQPFPISSPFTGSPTSTIAINHLHIMFLQHHAKFSASLRWSHLPCVMETEE